MPNPACQPVPPHLLDLRAVRTLFLRSQFWIDADGKPTAPSPATLRRWADSDVLPGIPVGGKKFIPKATVLQFLAKLSLQHRQICG